MIEVFLSSNECRHIIKYYKYLDDCRGFSVITTMIYEMYVEGLNNDAQDHYKKH